MSDTLQVLVVDDHATVRQGLMRILTSAEPGWQVHDVPNAQAALALAERQHFDVGVVDMSMPGMNGIELVAALRARGHRWPLMMLSMHAEEAYALRAFQAGATGYITKDQAAEQLVEAVRTVASGGLHATPGLARRLRMNEHGAVERLPHASLSARELRVLGHWAAGTTLADTARALELTEPVVISARQRLLEKLGLDTLEQVVAYAQAHGLPTRPHTTMRIETDDLSRPEVHALLQEHLEDMYAWSPPESVHALDLERLRVPAITFWTAWEGDLLLGSAALKDLGDGHGEVKSMRTPRRLRGRGAGRALLTHLINHARARGFRRLSLETGSMEPFKPAQQLYESFGFVYCGPFGDYALDPHSVFMTLAL